MLVAVAGLALGAAAPAALGQPGVVAAGGGVNDITGRDFAGLKLLLPVQRGAVPFAASVALLVLGAILTFTLRPDLPFMEADSAGPALAGTGQPKAA